MFTDNWKYTLNKIIVFALTVMGISGCATNKYEHQANLESDSKVVFGEIYGGGSIISPARNLLVNISDNNLCSDYDQIGVVSNHWTGIGEKTREFYIPENTEVKLIGTYNLSSGDKIVSCKIGPVSFFNNSVTSYSIDVGRASKFCFISVIETNPGHEDSKIELTKVADKCEK